jgi:flagellar biosynthetic protein FliR
LLFGLFVRVSTSALIIAGTLIAQIMSLSQLFGSPQTETTTVYGNFLFICGVTILFLTKNHLLVLDLIQLNGSKLISFSGKRSLWQGSTLLDIFIYSFRLSIALSLPFIFVSSLYYLILGFINRAAPQLMIVLIGAPAVILLFLILIFLSSAVLLASWHRVFLSFLSSLWP